MQRRDLYLDGSLQTVVLDTTLNISSFGEDEAGELYVVALGGSVSRITQPPCSFSISPSSANVPSAGGTGNVGVTAGTGCSWTAVSNDTWIHVTSGANGSGNGTTGYSVDANASGVQRTGTMTIATRTFTATQQAGSECTYSISPSNRSFQRAGGTASVTVTAAQGCAWTAVNNASWIAITGGASGSGNGIVTYSVAPYGGPPKKRNGTMTIAGATFAISQTK